MRSIVTTGRDSQRDAWSGLNAEQRARIIRDMPIAPMDEPEPAWIGACRMWCAVGGATLAFYAIGVWLL